ncbi:MAG: hypothetical protein H7316_15660 [Tardiphaga sp.]|uniref:hypothetical protein n=1 Tax=Tardiphaga sp. TaxID=1926292 RepID=UPI0019BF4F46|nr:hypothetical protein [Tardiphaga sp.]MBC7585179.1 hypothetical protein [Tardiphaga sp.]
MTSLAEIDLVYALTSPHKDGAIVPSIEPLVAYLRSGAQVTNHLTKVLANLLDANSNHPLQLKLCRRDGRFMKSYRELDRDVSTFHRVQDLTGATVTPILVDEILRNLPGWTAKLEKNKFLVQRSGITELRLPIVKPISRNLALLIASFEFKNGFEAVKKMVLKTERAIAVC